MADDTFEPLDLAANDEYQAQVGKANSQPDASSAEHQADIALAVELYLVEYSSKGGYTLDDFRPYQQQIQDIITGDLRPEDAGSVATALDLLLNGNAQHSPDIPSKTSGVVAEPVHLGTGQFILSATDFVVAGAGIDLVFSRTYKSKAFYFGPLGASWDHACNLWLRDNGTSVTVTTGALLPIRYMLHQFFPFYVAIGDDSIVVATLDGAFEQRAADGRTVRFEQVGDADGTIYRVVRVADRFDNELLFAYDSQNRLETVRVNHPSRLVTFSYDQLSRIQSITLFPVTYETQAGAQLIQRRWTYVYNDFSDLIAVTGPATDEFPSGRTTQYAYSSSASSAERQHDLQTITDPNGHTFLENEFGTARGTVAYGKVVRQRVGSGVFMFDYAQVNANPAWDLSDVDRPASCATVVQRDGHPVRYVLNSMGNILASQETILGAGERKVVRRYAYDADGRLVATLTPEGRVTQTYYGREDFYRRQTSAGDESLPVWQDPHLSAAEHARFANILAGVQRSSLLTLTGLLDNLSIYGGVFPDVLTVTPDDIIVKFTYESTFQQRATISDPRYTASADPAALESQDPNSAYSKHLTVTAFNAKPGATPRSITYPDTTYPTPLPDGTTGVKAARKTFDAYEANGSLLQWTEPEGNVMSNSYVPPSSAWPTSQGFLAASTVGLGELDLVTAYNVNEAGQLIAVTDPIGNKTEYVIDAVSLRRKAIPAIAGYGVDYSYDGNGQVLSRATPIIDPDGTPVPGSPEIASFAYNEELSVVQSAIGDSSGTVRRKSQRIYDASNRLIRMVKPRGNSTCYEYDARSLLKQVSIACCEREAATTAFRHDLDEIAVGLTDPRGHVTSTKLDALARPVERVDALGNLQRTDYDKLNNPLIQWRFAARTLGTYSLLRRTEYVYDERGQLIRIRKAFFKDSISTTDPWRGPDTEFLAAVQAGQVEWYDTLIFRDGNLRVFRVMDALGDASTAEYDAADRQIATTDPMGNVARTTYDSAGNVIRQDRCLVDSSGLTRAVISSAYEYDELNRLQAAIDGAGNRATYGLDSRGLVRTVTDPLGHLTTYGYNVFRDLVSTTQELLTPGGPVIDLTTTSSFDPNGNIVGITDPSGNTTRIDYDLLDRPIRIVNPDDTVRTFAYDRSSNLIGVVDEEGVATLEFYDDLDQLTGVVIQSLGPSPVSAEQSAQFSYDGAGTMTAHANSFLSVTRNCDSLGRCYEERLTFGPPLQVAASPLTLTRQFDGVSNRIALDYPSGQALVYSFDQGNQLLQLKSIANATGYPGDPAALPIRSILQRQR